MNLVQTNLKRPIRGQNCRVEFGMAMSIRFVHNGDVWDCVIWIFVDNHIIQSGQYHHSNIAAIPKSTLL